MIWPLVVLGVMHFTKSMRALFALCCAGAIASATWMYVLYDGGLNTNRVYLGTDTRSQCLFIGCALAVGLVLVSQRSHEVGRLAEGELWRPQDRRGQIRVRRHRRRRCGRCGRALGADDLDLVVPRTRAASS